MTPLGHGARVKFLGVHFPFLWVDLSTVEISNTTSALFYQYHIWIAGHVSSADTSSLSEYKHPDVFDLADSVFDIIVWINYSFY